MSLRSSLLKAIAVFALALTPILAAPPEGKVEINYHRCDGVYTKWGVHLWKSPNMPLPDIEWPNPMKPTGTNDFGVYWHADLAEFNTGSKAQVNYIIHKGEVKEQGGKDMKFSSKTSREVWINGGDRKIYASPDDAKKARAENPCP